MMTTMIRFAMTVMAVLALGAGTAAAGKVGKDCRLKGKKLHGKVQIVNSFPDFKVRVVTSFPDVNVEKVSSFPDKCGQWQIVDSFPDFKIQLVDSFSDFDIQYVTSFPGVP
jgi:hypothetical protein